MGPWVAGVNLHHTSVSILMVNTGESKRHNMRLMSTDRKKYRHLKKCETVSRSFRVGRSEMYRDLIALPSLPESKTILSRASRTRWRIMDSLVQLMIEEVHHPSLPSSTVSTEWSRSLKDGRWVGSLFQHSLMSCCICRRKNIFHYTFHCSNLLQSFCESMTPQFSPPEGIPLGQEAYSPSWGGQSGDTQSSDLVYHCPSAP